MRVAQGSVYVCTPCRRTMVDIVDVSNRWCPECKRWDGGDKAPANPLWKTKDGRVMPISEMTQEHLQYTINLILTRDDWRRHFMDPLLQELKQRKERREATEASDGV